MTHRTVCLVCPTMWDEAELPAASARAGIPYRSHGTDVSENPGAFDALSFIDATAALIRAEGLSGVMASDDYPGSIVSAALAHELGFPGPSPEVVLRCQHKFYGRLAQRESVPEAVPDFALVDPCNIEAAASRLRFPVFVKPVKSFFSLFARRVHDRHGLESLAHAARDHFASFVKPLDQLIAKYAPSIGHGGGYLLAEAPLEGVQVTFEGCVFRGEMRAIGIVDSTMYPGTISFARFEYPSALPHEVQGRMADIARRFVRHIGFDNGLFNIEMMYDRAQDRIGIIEVNPRMCPQFADLMEKVNGVNTYEIALSIAAGREPVVRRPTALFAVAASVVARVFDDRLVRRIPSHAQRSRLAESFPDARLKVLCREGHRLSEELQDGNSYRYALLNLGGDSREHIAARYAEAMRLLHFELQAVTEKGSVAAAD